MENNIKKTNRAHKPETKEKISNTQRMRVAKYKRALKENEFRKLELENPYDNVPLDDYELMLELKFQIADEFNSLLDEIYRLFKHQLQMEKNTSKEQKVNEVLSKVDINSVVENILNDFIDKDKNFNNDEYENN